MNASHKPVSRRGRPPILTLERVQAVGELIALGLTEEQACMAEGINPETFGPACCRNGEFRNALKEKQAEFLANAVRHIAAGATGWQGRAWLLERRHKPQFSRSETFQRQSPVSAQMSASELLSTLAWAAQQNPLLVPPKGKGARGS